MTDRYPEYPGYKIGGTSQEAADAIAPVAKTLRSTVLNFLRERYPADFTADEIADGLGASILSIRPRVSELKRLRAIEQTEQRGRNASGMSAHRFRARMPQIGGAA